MPFLSLFLSVVSLVLPLSVTVCQSAQQTYFNTAHLKDFWSYEYHCYQFSLIILLALWKTLHMS